MTATEVEAYLHRHIPLSVALGLRAVSVEEGRVVLEAPLSPNANHRETAFGGSVSALAILAGWSVVHFRLRAEGVEAATVIQHNSVRYDAPIAGTFRATAGPVPAAEWSKLTRSIERWGKGRVRVDVAVSTDEGVAAEFRGSFVALSGRPLGGPQSIEAASA